MAVPIGLASAIYLSEYASDRARNILKPVLEVLAGVPTVVYGFFALTLVTPLLKAIFPETQVFNAASAASLLGLWCYLWSLHFVMTRLGQCPIV